MGGKGTQCDRICVKYGYTHMSSGDLLRNEVLSGTPRGRQLYALMADGKPVPNEYVNDLLAETMVKKAASKGFLIDGFPMDSEQADSFLQERLKSRNNFDDTEESILKRIDSYNQKTKPVADKFEAKIVSAERTADEIFPDVQAIMDGVK